MARAYTVATAALALDVSVKWLDNTLSHFNVQGVTQTRQGVARRLPIESLTILAIAVSLIRALDTPVQRAIDLATQLTRSNGTIAVPGDIQINIDVQHTTDLLLGRLEHAVEIAPLPRRGRPPQKTTGRLD
jgi:hypothetical protein